jgi:hypothetical protein
MNRYRIWDIDNCLSDDRPRIKLIDWTPGLNGDQRYGAYHEACRNDEPGNEDTFWRICLSSTPVFFTARPEPVRVQTERWLLRQLGVRHPLILMRQVAEFVPSVALKQQMLDRFRRELGAGDRIEHAYDDREDICEMYRRNGIPATVLKIHDECAYTNPATLEKLHG